VKVDEERLSQMLSKLAFTSSILLLCCATLYAQKTAKKTPPPKDPEPEVLAISSYMRQAGLLYVESLKKYDDMCWKEGSTAETCDLAIKQIDEDGILNSIEDRMDININEHPSDADEDYRGLLKTTRFAESFFLFKAYMFKLHARKSEEMFKAAGLVKTCTMVAHDIAIKGIFDDSLWHCEQNVADYLKETKGNP
jgi:hypothetical protein